MAFVNRSFNSFSTLFIKENDMLFKVKKALEVAVSHRLNLPYESKCQNDHGHNLLITVYCQAHNLNESGMVVDFTEIKRIVHGQLDHQCLNDIEGIGWVKTQDSGVCLKKNPTAERLAEWIYMQIDSCYRVDVQESTGNTATYEEE